MHAGVPNVWGCSTRWCGPQWHCSESCAASSSLYLSLRPTWWSYACAGDSQFISYCFFMRWYPIDLRRPLMTSRCPEHWESTMAGCIYMVSSLPVWSTTLPVTWRSPSPLTDERIRVALEIIDPVSNSVRNSAIKNAFLTGVINKY